MRNNKNVTKNVTFRPFRENTTNMTECGEFGPCPYNEKKPLGFFLPCIFNTTKVVTDEIPVHCKRKAGTRRDTTKKQRVEFS